MLHRLHHLLCTNTAFPVHRFFAEYVWRPNRKQLLLFQNIVEQVAPVAKHVHYNTTTIFFPVIPGGALRRDSLAFEHPVPKLTAYRKYLPKNPCCINRCILSMPGNQSLSCTTPCFTPAFSQRWYSPSLHQCQLQPAFHSRYVCPLQLLSLLRWSALWLFARRNR